MASTASIEILDLRHFAAPVLRPVLEAEGELWKQRLHWDYRTSTRLLMQYLDSHMLPGYAALESGQVTGYVFCVYEETKAVIGDVFALSPPGGADAGDGMKNPRGAATADGLSASAQPVQVSAPAGQASAHEIEETLLKHLFETLLNSPQLDRIESQLLLHPSGAHADLFRQAGFDIYRRLFMVQQLQGIWTPPRVDLPSGLELRPWREEDLIPAGRLISEAYRDHPDSLINDQYRSVHGSQRFLHNIVRYAGCGVFSPQISHVVVERHSRELVALVLGSRVSPQSGHITQVCVHPQYRRRGVARMLLAVAAFHFMRHGATEISLTVTESNADAIDLYRAEGYVCAHTFDAAVWQREQIA
ncbi:MAG: GNAT family N-acetyltransferase [Terracidiphilus sp.]|jgi:ribosomal protein S18 acetylase RimI-like enzyme